MFGKRRKIRSDCTVGEAETWLGIKFRRDDGRDIRSDCKIGTLRDREKRRRKK